MTIDEFANLLENLHQVGIERLGIDRDLVAVLTRIAERLDDDQPHYTNVKTLTVPPGHVTVVRSTDTGEIIAYKVRVRT